VRLTVVATVRYRNAMARVKYACDLDKSVLVNNFEKRGWVSVLPDEEWNFYWCEIRYRTGF